MNIGSSIMGGMGISLGSLEETTDSLFNIGDDADNTVSLGTINKDIELGPKFSSKTRKKEYDKAKAIAKFKLCSDSTVNKTENKEFMDDLQFTGKNIIPESAFGSVDDEQFGDFEDEDMFEDFEDEDEFDDTVDAEFEDFEDEDDTATPEFEDFDDGDAEDTEEDVPSTISPNVTVETHTDCDQATNSDTVNSEQDASKEVVQDNTDDTLETKDTVSVQFNDSDDEETDDDQFEDDWDEAEGADQFEDDWDDEGDSDGEAESDDEEAESDDEEANNDTETTSDPQFEDDWDDDDTADAQFEDDWDNEEESESTDAQFEDFDDDEDDEDNESTDAQFEDFDDDEDDEDNDSTDPQFEDDWDDGDTEDTEDAQFEGFDDDEDDTASVDDTQFEDFDDDDTEDVQEGQENISSTKSDTEQKIEYIIQEDAKPENNVIADFEDMDDAFDSEFGDISESSKTGFKAEDIQSIDIMDDVPKRQDQKQVNRPVQNVNKQASSVSQQTQKLTERTTITNNKPNNIQNNARNATPDIKGSVNGKNSDGKPTKAKEHSTAQFDSLSEAKLYELVKKYLVLKKVNQNLVDIELLNKQFGANNVKKLIKKSYLIKLGNKVTIARGSGR